jgi:hypothetical protein
MVCVSCALMRRAGLAGATDARSGAIPSPTRWPPTWSTATSPATEPNQLWVTDMTEHPTREGKLYCAVVLDSFRSGGRLVDRCHADCGDDHQHPRHGHPDPHSRA